MAAVSFTASTADDGSRYQLIADPNPSLGSPGDIEDQSGWGTYGELDTAGNECSQSWAQAGSHAQGITVIELGRFVDESGIPTETLGAVPEPSLELFRNPRYCGPQKEIFPGDLPPYASVVDPTNARMGDIGIALAHELGHSLLLVHGDGLDNNSNGLYDRFCDPNEVDTSVSLMSAMNNNTVITGFQAQTARAAALAVPGATQATPSSTVRLANTFPPWLAHLIRDLTSLLPAEK